MAMLNNQMVSFWKLLNTQHTHTQLRRKCQPGLIRPECRDEFSNQLQTLMGKHINNDIGWTSIMTLWSTSIVCLFGFVWFCLVLFGFVWFCLVLLGFVWFCLVLFGFVLFGLFVCLLFVGWLVGWLVGWFTASICRADLNVCAYLSA